MGREGTLGGAFAAPKAAKDPARSQMTDWQRSAAFFCVPKIATSSLMNNADQIPLIMVKVYVLVVSSEVVTAIENRFDLLFTIA
jgi:hypothetical protein